MHADRELRIAGYYDKDSDYAGLIPNNVLDLLQCFGNQGHSGMSANLVVQLFGALAMFKPLTPLTGKDDEWNERGTGLWQNNRCSHVFKDDSGAYDSHGKVFREKNGCCYTNCESKVMVTFPYIPKSEYVDVSSEIKE